MIFSFFDSRWGQNKVRRGVTLQVRLTCMRDLRVYTDALLGTVYHYRDKNNLECDAVLHLRNGHYGLVEIKLGGDKLIEEGAAMLKSLAKKLICKRCRNLLFLMVLTAVGRYAYRRGDGVK